MENEEIWLVQAKKTAKSEAEDFVESMQSIAESLDVDKEWFLEEVIKNIHQLKKE